MNIAVGQDVMLNSPGEALFWGLCHFHEAPVERSDQFAICTSPGGPWYHPGFRVCAPRIVDVWVEVADGQEDAARHHGRDCWRQGSTLPLVVLYREDLDALREARYLAQFLARLRQTQGQRRLPPSAAFPVMRHGLDMRVAYYGFPC
jgi:hypothetical protein